MHRTLMMVMLLAVALPAQAATETNVTVRAVSRDAKVIGSGVGGARITIADAKSGEILAAGVQLGATGDTEAIMVEPHRRGSAIYEGAAAFRTTLLLDEPTAVVITAEGPLGHPEALRKVSKEVLLVPGEHIDGDGIILEIHGFIIDVLAPDPAVASAGEPFAVEARMAMT